eukprot:33277-Karenia_brevis.AAC.1
MHYNHMNLKSILASWPCWEDLPAPPEPAWSQSQHTLGPAARDPSTTGSQHPRSQHNWEPLPTCTVIAGTSSQQALFMLGAAPST